MLHQDNLLAEEVVVECEAAQCFARQLVGMIWRAHEGSGHVYKHVHAAHAAAELKKRANAVDIYAEGGL